MDTKRYLDEITDVISFLAAALEQIVAKIGMPRWIHDDPKRARFRYDNPDERTLQALMLVRIVSGLQAAMILIRFGHTTEAGVIFRTIDDFLGDIWFVDEALGTDKRTAKQEEFISHYFIDRSHTTEELLRDPPR